MASDVAMTLCSLTSMLTTQGIARTAARAKYHCSYSHSWTSLGKSSTTSMPLSVPSDQSERAPVPPVPGGYLSPIRQSGLLKYLWTSSGGWGMVED